MPTFSIICAVYNAQYIIKKSSKKAIIKNYKSIFQTSKSSWIGTVRLIINRLLH